MTDFDIQRARRDPLYFASHYGRLPEPWQREAIELLVHPTPPVFTRGPVAYAQPAGWRERSAAHLCLEVALERLDEAIDFSHAGRDANVRDVLALILEAAEFLCGKREATEG